MDLEAVGHLVSKKRVACAFNRCQHEKRERGGIGNSYDFRAYAWCWALFSADYV